MGYKVLVTNDDGYLSYGMRVLAGELSRFSNVTVVCPDRPRSAAGFSLTLKEPLRVMERRFGGIPYYLVSGTPGDCVTLALFHILDEKPDIVVSGINIGENVSLIEFFMSGTVGGAIAGAVYGIPSIAFSKVVPEKDVLTVEEVREGMDVAAKISSEIVRFLLRHGFPADIDLISVNYPAKIDGDTEVKVTRLARLSLSIKVYIREDPRGTPYYWIWGEKFGNFPIDSDAYTTLVSNNISITPVKLDGMSVPPSGLDRLANFLNKELSRFLQ